MRSAILFLIFLLMLFESSVSFGQYFDPKSITMHWLDSEDHPLLTFDNVRRQQPELVFLTNGGKFNKRHEPIGLYIENGKQYKPLIREENPKLQPATVAGGVFYIKEGNAYIETIKPNLQRTDILYAVQSTPMLVINGKMNSRLSLKEISMMRNGVGITKEGKVYFACMEATERSFANHFIDAGCIQALQLDTEVSRVWHHNIKEKVYGRFGVMIGAK